MNLERLSDKQKSNRRLTEDDLLGLTLSVPCFACMKSVSGIPPIQLAVCTQRWTNWKWIKQWLKISLLIFTGHKSFNATVSHCLDEHLTIKIYASEWVESSRMGRWGRPDMCHRVKNSTVPYFNDSSSCLAKLKEWNWKEWISIFTLRSIEERVNGSQFFKSFASNWISENSSPTNAKK